MQPQFAALAHNPDRFVLAHRPARAVRDPWRHQGVIVEQEAAGGGRTSEVATVFLTGRECPWRCVMCDLWKHTTEHDTPPGALVEQLDAAFSEGRIDPSRVSAIKLYNAGSFFDPRAVPVQDYPAIASRVAAFETVIVESHPALVGPRLAEFQAALGAAARDRGPTLEVAMGLETAHPDALRRLNKHFTRDEFRRAADRLHAGGCRLRVFLLVGVPFIDLSEQQDWLIASARYAFECGAAVVSLIPTRPDNGTMEVLTAEGMFVPPTLRDVEIALESALALCSRPRVGAPFERRMLADLWDLARLASCAGCFELRRARLHQMNLMQRVLPRIVCATCGGGERIV